MGWPWLTQQTRTVCHASWQIRHFAELASHKVRVDGLRNVQEVVSEVEFVSEKYSRGVHLLAIGQPGIVSAFHVAAALRQNSLAPAFELASAREPAGFSSPGQEDWEKERNRLGPRSDRRRIYCLTFPPIAEWRAKVQRQIDSRLNVGNATQIRPLAKALAARSAVLPEGKAVALETALLEDEKLSTRRLRISHMAQVLALAHQWEVSPVDPSKPTRTFRCIAELARDKAGRSQSLGGWMLRLEVLPEGPPKPWPWSPEVRPQQ
mmetsp:Transcript_42400/g.70286  ORF Transcript_42400/g.70286 Transcript_42400/m.70286 type:complete len:264 (-) Transcript_42400:57-848(-)